MRSAVLFMPIAWLMTASYSTRLNVLFSLYGGNRDLHSFPTRRSSDLESVMAIRRGERHQGRFDSLGDIRPGARSEEHTSELQSHSDLVCRLLLEKKNHGIPPKTSCAPGAATYHPAPRSAPPTAQSCPAACKIRHSGQCVRPSCSCLSHG